MPSLCSAVGTCQNRPLESASFWLQPCVLWATQIERQQSQNRSVKIQGGCGNLVWPELREA
ncbi:hypothetical protein SHAL103562_13045 [Shewanella algae]